MKRTVDKQLRRIYYDVREPGAYGGIEALLRNAKAKRVRNINRKRVITFLKQQEAYTLHKPIRRKYKRNPIIVRGIDYQWQADLADLSDIASANDGVRYLLTVIDCFSKYAWAIPLRRKDAASLVEAFKLLFQESNPRKPIHLQTDKGKEFINSTVQTYLKRQGVHLFSTHNVETKAAIVERFNRTLKSRMYRYFTAKDTKRYINILPHLLQAYNHSEHRTIGVRPFDVKKSNEKEIWHRVYGKHAGIMKPKTKPVISDKDKVRISKTKTGFPKGYHPNWSTEVFNIRENGVEATHPKKLYKLKDLKNESIEGRFYPEELQVVSGTGIYRVERVLKKRKVNKLNELLIKWKGWPKKFNTWIPENKLEKIQQDGVRVLPYSSK